MPDQFDQINGVEPEPKPWTKPKRQVRDRPRYPSRHQEEPPGNKYLKPEGVSERAWGLAEQWLDLGEAKFGKRPPVKRQGFSQRLSDKVQQDQRLRRLLRVPDQKFQPDYADSSDYVTAVVFRAMEMFFEHLTEEQGNTSRLQWDFLSDEWDEWIYEAIKSLQVRWINKHDLWQKPPPPPKIFSMHTEPDPDEVHPDPFFNGMTRAQVRAQNEEDLKSLPSRSDEEHQALVDQDRRQWEARAKALRKRFDDRVSKRHSEREETTT